MNKTRKRILDAAYLLFYERGFPEVGVDVIAKYSGVTRQTLYNHFETKGDIILEVILQRDQWWREKLRDCVDACGRDPERQLRSFCSTLLQLFTTHRVDRRLFICAAATFPLQDDPIHLAAKANIDAVKDLIAKIARRVGIADSNYFAELFNTIIAGIVTADVIDHRDSREAETGMLTNLLIDKFLRSYHVAQARGLMTV